MRRLRKKKGSSLIMVVFITAIIFTTATSMIALVTTDYKHRINDSKRLQNLYQAESGLDIVNNVIIKNSDAAIVYANAKVREYIKLETNNKVLVTDSDQAIYNKTNEKFKENFIQFLGKDQVAYANAKLDKTTFTNPKTEDMLIYGILNCKYVKLDTALIEPINEEGQRRMKTSDSTSVYVYPYTWETIDRTIAANQEAKIEILSYTYDETNFKITVKVKSTFNTKSAVDGSINKKIITTKFIVNAPNYAQAVNTSSTPVETYEYPIQKAIITDKNLNVNSGTTTVNGDVLVQGDYTGGATDTSVVYNKYLSGIFIKKDATFNVNKAVGITDSGNVFTAGTYNLQNNSESTIQNSLYALNVYVGPRVKSILGISKDNMLDVKNEVLTNNDLTLNATDSTIKIKDFYGMNDLTTSNKYNVTTDSAKAAKESSSIIINSSNNNPSIDIEKAYVMGVAYVNTDRTYGTGESVAVGDNYLAYTDKLPGETGEYLFEYYDPLYMVARTMKNGVMSDMSTEDKAAYFANYYNKKDPSNTYSNINTGGVKIEKLYAVGTSPIKDATTQKYRTTGGITIEDAKSIISPKKEAFVKQVFCMGSLSDGQGINDKNELLFDQTTKNYIWDKLYQYNQVVKTVENQIDWRVPEYIPSTNEVSLGFAENKGKFIYNTDPDTEIVIDSDFIYVKRTGVSDVIINAKLNTAEPDCQNAVIITKGKITIKKGTKFKGSIVACGDIDINSTDAEPVSIVYDKQTVLDITAKYNSKIYYVLNNGAANQETIRVFKGTPLNTNSTVITASKSVGAASTSDSNYFDAQYDADAYLKKGLWTIEKK